MIYKPPKIIAEACCNHAGNIETAKRMIRMADICGMNVVKFQKRDVDAQALMYPFLYDNPHPHPEHSFGKTYKDHRKALEFNPNQHAELKRYIECLGMEYSCSVWDIVSALDIINLRPSMIKIPSACNTHYAMMDVLKKKYKGDIHISLGMTTPKELSQILRFWKNNFSRIILYHCTSGYPVPAEEMHLLEIEKLLKIGVKGVGLSSHYPGYSMCLEAQALGAEWFEKHITLDRFARGTDHQAALEFLDLRNLVRDLKAGYQALTQKPPGICEIEKEQRTKLKYGISRSI